MPESPSCKGFTSAQEALHEVKTMVKRGELLSAYDLSVQALGKYPDNVQIKHQCVLSLARAGATEQAFTLYAKLNLDQEPHEDIRALSARLWKDRALSYPPHARRQPYLDAARCYEKIYDDTHGYYPGINAATLYRLAGENGRSTSLAHSVLEKIHGETTIETPDAYYREATRVEAYILLETWDAAEKHVALARRFSGQDLSAVATTRKQLRTICPEERLYLLAHLKNPAVIHYAGHRIDAPHRTGARFSPSDEASVKKRIDALLEQHHVGFGSGSLACGADILFAEALLSRNAHLEIYLPFCIEEFLDSSVRSGGPGWEERFFAILSQVSQIYYATEDQYLGDDSLFNYCSQLAMGQAILRAQFLEAEVLQIVVWDGQPATGIAGTAIDLQCWHRLGHRQEIIPLPNFKEPAEHFWQEGRSLMAGEEAAQGHRVLRAILFGDVKGFSKLKEAQISIFVDKILGIFGHVLERFAGQILFRNTWGDGLFIILPDVQTAARCALELQAELARQIQADQQFASHALRLGAHFGPVIERYDPVMKTVNYFGVHISRAARVEPVTPEGKVYATWPFASQLAMLQDSPFRATYVGHLPAAKSYGLLKMYLIEPRAALLSPIPAP